MEDSREEFVAFLLPLSIFSVNWQIMSLAKNKQKFEIEEMFETVS